MMKKVNLLSKAEMKKVLGGDVVNPNCNGMGPADWYCKQGEECHHVGYMSCEDGAAKCVLLGGSLLTDSPSCTPLVIID